MHLCGHAGQATQVLQMVHYYSDSLKRAKSMFFMFPPFCLPFFLFFKSISFPAAASCSCAGMATVTAMLRSLAMLQAHTKLIHYYREMLALMAFS